jgi:hypothetical protein
MRAIVLFALFFAIAVNGNFLHDFLRQKVHQAQQFIPGEKKEDKEEAKERRDEQQKEQNEQQQKQQQQQQGGQMKPPLAIDCWKFNNESTLSQDIICLPTTLVLHNDSHWAYCDSTLLLQIQQSQGNQTQQISQDFISKLCVCTIDRIGTLNCQVTQPEQQTQQQQQPQQPQQQTQNFVSYPFYGCVLYPQTELNITSIGDLVEQIDKADNQDADKERKQQAAQQQQLDDVSFDYFCVKTRPFSAANTTTLQNPCTKDQESKECKDFKAGKQEGKEEGKQGGA